MGVPTSGNKLPPFGITSVAMQLFYRILADVIVVVHAAFVLFVVAGLVLILVGRWRGWRWICNVWFRGLHLVAIAFVVVETWFGIVCPLTEWEHSLRELAGQTTYRGDFIAHWVHEALFFELPPWAFTAAYTLFGLAVLATLFFIPPRMNRFKTGCR
jgi:hypothetical protein